MLQTQRFYELKNIKKQHYVNVEKCRISLLKVKKLDVIQCNTKNDLLISKIFKCILIKHNFLFHAEVEIKRREEQKWNILQENMI